MKSMTGFGHASGEVLGVRCLIEVRSVNHRYLDLKLRLAPLWNDPLVEHLCQQHVRRRVERGSVSVTLRDEGRVRGEPVVRVDMALGEAYGQALVALRRHLRIADAVDLGPSLLALVAAQPGVLQASDASLAPEQVFQQVEPILDKALAQLADTRQREGYALAEDLRRRVGLLGGAVSEVAALAEAAPEQLRRRLAERLARLLQGTAGVDPARVAQEVALLADRIDISEELTRLRVHLGEFERLCSTAESAGRRLDFLTQEMNREVNTIGSKAQSAEVTARVVAMKAELERLREQIQNVE